MKLSPYLNFNGNCRAAFLYYEKHLGGKIQMMMTHGDGPPNPNMPADWGTAILHAQIQFGDTILMASDVPPDRQQPIRSAYLHLELEGIEEAERAFGAVIDGGEAIMPMAETFWAPRFGLARDAFGVLWMISAAPAKP
ncbi:MAG: VOC family protein [Bryobacterales bacterium]|nr:VOC family protein [Bryobacterales bacterium]